MDFGRSKRMILAILFVERGLSFLDVSMRETQEVKLTS
jgi:hypothetical protein